MRGPFSANLKGNDRQEGFLVKMWPKLINKRPFLGQSDQKLHDKRLLHWQQEQNRSIRGLFCARTEFMMILPRKTTRTDNAQSLPSTSHSVHCLPINHCCNTKICISRRLSTISTNSMPEITRSYPYWHCHYITTLKIRTIELKLGNSTFFFCVFKQN